jgi:hypothetical protein
VICPDCHIPHVGKPEGCKGGTWCDCQHLGFGINWQKVAHAPVGTWDTCALCQRPRTDLLIHFGSVEFDKTSLGNPGESHRIDSTTVQSVPVNGPEDRLPRRSG